jgi:hypothetical protein
MGEQKEMDTPEFTLTLTLSLGGRGNILPFRQIIINCAVY